MAAPAAAHCGGYCARGWHRAAGYGKQERLMRGKTFQPRGGCHDGQTKSIRRKI
jgi:hypothetical protein